MAETATCQAALAFAVPNVPAGTPRGAEPKSSSGSTDPTGATHRLAAWSPVPSQMNFTRPLATGVRIVVDTDENRPFDRYAVMLQVRVEKGWKTIRLFDNAHGQHDLHGYTGFEKQPATRFKQGTLKKSCRLPSITWSIIGKRSSAHGGPRDE